MILYGPHEGESPELDIMRRGSMNVPKENIKGDTNEFTVKELPLKGFGGKLIKLIRD